MPQVDFPDHLWYKNMLSLQIASSNIILLNLVAIFAGVAQLAEQLICNQQVAGSSPIASSNISEKNSILTYITKELVLTDYLDLGSL